MTKTVLQKKAIPSGNFFLRYQFWFEIAFVIMYGCYYFLWSMLAEYNFGPDEIGRYCLPEYIYQNGSLPVGNEPEVQISKWGFSYAYYPTFLGPLLSAFFMKITSFFTIDTFALVVAARFTSVLSGALTVWFLLRCGGRLFSIRVKWIVAFLLASIPQFAFLSSYVNNDMLCVCGSAIICCAWVCGLQDGWNLKNTVLLSAGIVVVALSYYNGYGWILCSIGVFFLSYFLKTPHNTSYRSMWKWCGLIVLLVLLFVAFFFIRNAILHNGDFLGLKTIETSSQLNAEDFLKPNNRQTPKNIGISMWDMLFTTHYNPYNWLNLTFCSFIGIFGYMEFSIPTWIYQFYLGVFLVGSVCFVGSVVGKIVHRKHFSKEEKRTCWLFCIALIVALIVPILLSLYYSYATDYQPQGRYIYTMIIALMILIGIGIEWLLKWIPVKWVKNVLSGCFCFFVTGITLYVFTQYYLPVLYK